MEITHFAVGNTGEHSGFTATRQGPAFPAEGGWTFQDVIGAHGHILYEGPSAEEAQEALDKFLVCTAPADGAYCYTHNSDGR